MRSLPSVTALIDRLGPVDTSSWSLHPSGAFLGNLKIAMIIKIKRLNEYVKGSTSNNLFTVWLSSVEGLNFHRASNALLRCNKGPYLYYVTQILGKNYPYPPPITQF